MIARLMLEDGTSTTWCLAMIAFLILVRKSAIGSVIIFFYFLTFDDFFITSEFRFFYQLAFLMPGINPDDAISRN
jgi:hypothetical protein